ncbi:hypothetical protein Daus18300_002301 [Diaporthe australafricana]|uniref:Uncharacterized protein n=1 Tax=Diaporthe australafricana TaxID=127596 RepID=A0ABR3XQZ5_9PEZI
MVAVAIHQIAVYVYKLDLNLGGHQDFAVWKPPKSDDMVFYQYYPDGKLPSLFFHKYYRDHDQYPDRDIGLKRELSAVSFYLTVGNLIRGNLMKITYRIWRLLETQKKRLLDFLFAENSIDGQTNGVENPLPILPDRTNLTRIDPEESIHNTGIYRDLWERKPLGDKAGDPRLHCCAYNAMDYPTVADYKRSLERALRRRREVEERREKEVEAEMEEEAPVTLSEQQEEEDETGK